MKIENIKKNQSETNNTLEGTNTGLDEAENESMIQNIRKQKTTNQNKNKESKKIRIL